jgi:hypothetical protein
LRHWFSRDTYSNRNGAVWLELKMSVREKYSVRLKRISIKYQIVLTATAAFVTGAGS